MIKEIVEKAINEQINWELYSGYFYLSMAAHFESTGLPGFANWMRNQAKEEQFHAMKFFDYLNERGGRVQLKAIEEPPHKWDSPLRIFEETYVHEQKVTGLINDLVDLAFEEKDHATYNMLQWFVDEQVEEEANASEIVDKLKLIGDDTSTLFMLDQEFAKRVFSPPAE
jgi:ferritin